MFIKCLVSFVSYELSNQMFAFNSFERSNDAIFSASMSLKMHFLLITLWFCSHLVLITWDWSLKLSPQYCYWYGTTSTLLHAVNESAVCQMKNLKIQCTIKAALATTAAQYIHKLEFQYDWQFHREKGGFKCKEIPNESNIFLNDFFLLFNSQQQENKAHIHTRTHAPNVLTEKSMVAVRGSINIIKQEWQ